MTRTDPLPRFQKKTAYPAVVLTVVIAAFSTYLFQRALADIAVAAPRVLAWSRETQINLMGLRFSYLTLTIAWPLVLGTLCLAVRHLVRRQLLIASSEKDGWCGGGHAGYQDGERALLGQELALPMTTFIWYVVALLPSIALVLHLMAGMSTLALLRSPFVRELASGSVVWTVQYALLAAVSLAVVSSFGLWSAVRYAWTMMRLRTQLLESASPSATKAGGTGGRRASDASTVSAPASSAGREYPRTWQVFISAKKLDEVGQPTRDSLLGDELYEFMTCRGLRVFFSSRSLELVGVSAYKKAIDDALDQCQVLVAVGTSAENLDSDWVRYEWDSFLNDILSGVKKEGRIFAYLDGVVVSDLPRPLRQTQVFQHGPHEMERLLSFIQNALPTGTEGF